MKYSFLPFVMLALAGATEIARSQVQQYGPPASPLSWTVVETKKPLDRSAFPASRDLLGDVPDHPVSVRLANLIDERPFGERKERRVYLARFESVTVRAPDDTTHASIALTVAYDAQSNDLVCAFTDPSPQWAVSTLPAADITSRAKDAGWEISPARYDALKSSLTDVLAAAWKRFAVDPSKEGQVIIRPRFVANKFPADNVQGTYVAQYPPSNVWIVEALGAVVMVRRVDGEVWNLTTLVAQFRDGDLMDLPSMILP